LIPSDERHVPDFSCACLVLSRLLGITHSRLHKIPQETPFGFL
jgi:hypothetical protein